MDITRERLQDIQGHLAGEVDVARANLERAVGQLQMVETLMKMADMPDEGELVKITEVKSASEGGEK